jgi:hypothetical protein
MTDMNVPFPMLRQRSEQLRAEVFQIMFESGDEYADAMLKVIAKGTESDSQSKRVFSMFAEIGWLEIFINAGETMDDE